MQCGCLSFSHFALQNGCPLGQTAIETKVLITIPSHHTPPCQSGHINELIIIADAGRKPWPVLRQYLCRDLAEAEEDGDVEEAEEEAAEELRIVACIFH